MLRTYLKEDPNSGEEEARVSLGEALLAVGQTDEGLKVLEEAIAFAPRHPSTYRARYLAGAGLRSSAKSPRPASSSATISTTSRSRRKATIGGIPFFCWADWSITKPWLRKPKVGSGS